MVNLFRVQRLFGRAWVKQLCKKKFIFIVVENVLKSYPGRNPIERVSDL